jgi:hypothetical protein
MNVWSSGGGVQSSAIAALICQGELNPDLCVIIDTERELSTTWDYLDKYVEPALKAVGHKIHRVKKSEFATVDLYSKNGDILIPAYTRESGELGKMPTFCSNEWKQRVMQRWLRSQDIKEATIWMGMTTDELQRVRITEKPWVKRYPLVELRMNRGDCISLVESMGWPTPPKSTCWMCPNKLPSHWEEMRGTIDWHRAVKFEEEMRDKDPDLYLHRQGVPLTEIEEDTDQYDMFCDSGMCFV